MSSFVNSESSSVVNERVLKYKVVFYNDALLKMLGNIEPKDLNNLIKK